MFLAENIFWKNDFSDIFLENIFRRKTILRRSKRSLRVCSRSGSQVIKGKDNERRPN